MLIANLYLLYGNIILIKNYKFINYYLATIIYNFISGPQGGVTQLTLNAQPQQITSQRSIGIEVTRDGAAPAFVTVTIEANNTTA